MSVRPERYPEVEPGKWVTPTPKGYKMACCDCGLIHRLDFRIRKGRIELRAFRDNRATGQFRRWHGITVRHEEAE